MIRANRYGNLTYANQSIDSWFGTGNTFCASGVNNGTCAYGEMAPGNLGNASKGTERAPDFRTLDLSVGNKFSVSEKTYLDFRAEFFNAFNHSSFGPPGSISSLSTFGFITSTITSPRSIELGLKYYF